MRKSYSCPRRWQVDAFEDGRLSDTDRASFEHHVAACLVCRDEVAQQHAANAMFANAPAPAWSPLDRQRARSELLARANDAFLESGRARVRPRHLALAAAAVVAVVSLYPQLRALRATSASVDLARPAPAYEFRGERPATAPDRDEAAPARNLSTSAAPAIDRLGDEEEARLFVHSRVSGDATGRTLTPSSASHPIASAGSRFNAAVASFEAGEHDRADRELERFQRDFPADPRCEDAAYLRAVARFRRGDGAGAATLARAYLSTYPTGLRAIEARRLSDFDAR